jgi:beta-galactosidase
MDIAVAGDLRGHLVGTVSVDGGTKGVDGAIVEARGATPLGPWRATAHSRPDGLFSIDLPPSSLGALELSAQAGTESARLAVDCSDIIHRLTPRPSAGTCRLPLEGSWELLPDPPGNRPWVSVAVPSHWEMEGIIAETGKVAYRRTVRVPSGWSGKRIKLRCDGIYSSAEVSVNTLRVGSHVGGATPFELDLSDVVRPGRHDLLEILVADRSTASTLDAMSYYAHANLGGIWRPLELFCVEPAHVSRLALETRFDADFRDADLAVDLDIDNEDAGDADGVRIWAGIVDPAGREQPLVDLRRELSLGPWQRQSLRLETRIRAPRAWTAETPSLYRLRVRLAAKGQRTRTMEQPFGFRQVQIRDGVYLFNGKPVKFWGACRHDAHPLRGRSITSEIARRDAELMKEANLNAFRASHYLPHPAALAWADRLGLYVEDEVPLCFIGVPWGPLESRDAPEDLRLAPLCIALTAETIERDRNHPSVSIWSQCNESRFGPILRLALEFAKALDPSRPISSGCSGDLGLKTFHNPVTADLVRENRDSPVPVLMDESFAIFQGMGPQAGTLESDPGLRDYWVVPHRDTVTAVRGTPRNLGGMIWAWVDDLFLAPGRGVEYGRMNLPKAHVVDRVYRMEGRGILGDPMWGVVDGWRRPLPEHWLCKKLHSPIVVREEVLPREDPVTIEVGNLNTFIDLDRYVVHWSLGSARGRAVVHAAPQASGRLQIRLGRTPDPADELRLEFRDGDGRCIDGFVLPFSARGAPALPWSGRAARFVEEASNLNFASIFRLVGSGGELAYDRVSGRLVRAIRDGRQAMQGGPWLHLRRNPRPLEEFPTGWKLAGVAPHTAGGRLVVSLDGSYADDFLGRFDLSLDDSGCMEISWRFENRGADVLANEIGVAFDLPPGSDRLRWDRAAEWSWYPEDHIGRPRGVALAHPRVGQSVPPGDRPYALDDHPWGCNDFRSTKRNVYRASLTDHRGTGIEVISDGSQHVRAALGINAVRLHILDYFGGTNANTPEWDRAYGTGRLVKRGGEIAGTVRIRLLGGTA